MVPGKASAFYDCYLKAKGSRQGDIRGDVTTKGHENSIKIVSWSFSGAIPAGVPMATAPITMQDFKVTMYTSLASPKLFQAFINKELLSTVELTALGQDTAGRSVLFLKITLTNAMVSSIVNLGNSKSADTRSMEEVTLRFSKIRIEVEGGVTVEYQQPPGQGPV
jgi:type VI secretion system secreted protein Hcp